MAEKKASSSKINSNKTNKSSIKTKAKSSTDNTLNKLKEDFEAEKDKFLRLFAEFENYKKRTAKERLDLFKTANRELMSSLIPVLEDFNRANKQSEKVEIKDQLDGFILIFNKFIEILKSNGLSESKAMKGDSFDSEIHEAITQIPSKNSSDKGKIIEVIEKGYELGDKIISYPKVVVGQ
jgi:molecular chaperone GrpE